MAITFALPAPTPDDQPQAAPAQPAAAPPAAAQAQPYKPSIMDILQGVLFNGQSPAEAAMAARGRQYQLQQQSAMMDALKSLPPDQRLAMLLAPGKYGEALASHVQDMALTEGQTRNGGIGGPSFTAPKLIFDPISGRGATQTPGATTPTGPSLGGGYKADNGLIISDRTGDVKDTYSLPEILAPGSSGVPFTPRVGGAAAIAPPPASGSGGPGPTPAGAPRGIRNNNFGNLRPLPSGHAWPGQTGVDPDGYAVFGDPADGVRAAAQNLGSYAAQGINTPLALAKKWAPASDRNDPTAYAHYLSGKLGVGPNDKIDLTNPETQQTLLRGIFDFENTPSAMAAWKGKTPARTAGQGGGFDKPFAQGAVKRILPPDDPAYSRFPAGTTLEQAPDGGVSVVQHPEYSPEAKSTIRDHVLSSDAYKQAKASMSAYQAMVANAGTMTGPSAYSMLDTFARAINPGAVARPTVIETIEKNLGLPAQLVGSLESKFGKGNLPPQVRQQIIDAVVPFAQAHWDQANMLNSANAALAKQHQFDPADVTGPLEGRPQRVIVAVPPATDRHPGSLYVTPKGPLQWTAKGWVQP